MSTLDLGPFCSKDKYRPALQEPFSRAGYTWATNGVVLIRVQLREDVQENAIAPHAERLITAHDGCTFTALPAISWPPAPDATECLACDGRGFEHDCPACGCECIVCDGTGKTKVKRSVEIRGVVFDVDYVRLISKLSDIEFTENPKESHPAPFRFAGGLGLLMPMKYPANLHLGDIENLSRAA